MVRKVKVVAAFSGRRNRNLARKGNKNNGRRGEMIRYVYPSRILPPKFVNMVRSAIQANVGMSVWSYYPNVFCLVFGNSIYRPYSSAINYSTSNAGGGMNMSSLSGSSTTQNTTGYTVMSGLYNTYRVLRSKMRVAFAPVSGADTFDLSISTSPYAEAQSTPLTPDGVRSQQNVVQKRITAGNMSTSRYLELDITPWDALGISKRQYLDLPVTTIGNFPTNSALYQFQINCQLIGTANAGVISGEFELELEVEWSSPNFGQLVS
jgi:hypothetical protein